METQPEGGITAQGNRRPDRRPLPAWQIHAMAERYLGGETIREIAAAYGLHYRIVRDRLIRQGVQLRAPARPPGKWVGRKGTHRAQPLTP